MPERKIDADDGVVMMMLMVIMRGRQVSWSDSQLTAVLTAGHWYDADLVSRCSRPIH